MCDEVWEILTVPAHHLSEAPAIHQPDQSRAGEDRQVPPLYQGSQTVRLLSGESSVKFKEKFNEWRIFIVYGRWMFFISLVSLKPTQELDNLMIQSLIILDKLLSLKKEIINHKIMVILI